MPDKFDPAAHDPAKVPPGWTPPPEEDGASFAAPYKKPRWGWYVCAALLALAAFERAVRYGHLHIN